MTSSQESLAVLFPDAWVFRWSPRCPLAYPRPGTGRCPGCTNGVTGQSESDFKPDNLEIFSAWTGLDLPTPSNHSKILVWWLLHLMWRWQRFRFSTFFHEIRLRNAQGMVGQNSARSSADDFLWLILVRISEDVTKSLPSKIIQSREPQNQTCFFQWIIEVLNQTA